MNNTIETINNLIAAAEALLLRVQTAEDEEYARFVVTASDDRRKFDAALKNIKLTMPKAVVRNRTKRVKDDNSNVTP